MRRLLIIVLGVVLIVMLGQTMSLGGRDQDKVKDKPGYAPGEIIIKFRSNATDAERSESRGQMRASVRRTFKSGAEHWKLGHGVTVEEAVERLSRHPRVEYVHPNHALELYATPNDPTFYTQWALHNTGQELIAGGTGGTPDADIDAPEAWDITKGCGSGTSGCSGPVRVAVLDTGIAQHNDLEANVDRNLSYDFADDDNNADPTCSAEPYIAIGHGTHVAGIIGAVGNNSIGISGVNWNVRLMALKIFSGPNTTGFVDQAIEAIEYAAANGADVINASWGVGACTEPCAPALKDAIEAAGEAGVVFVAAAGNGLNDNDTNPKYPASYDLDSIISVANTTSNDELAALSSYGQNSVDLGAPGTTIYSTVPRPLILCNGPEDPECDGVLLCIPPGQSNVWRYGGDYPYENHSGTSMAAPHVAGAAALLRARCPNISVAEIKNAIIGPVDPLPSLIGKTVSGGRLNAKGTLDDAILLSPAVTVVSPNGGGTYSAGSSINILWNAADVCDPVSTVDIYLSRNGFNGSYTQLFNDTPNDGSQPWVVTLPATSGFTAFIKVVASDPYSNSSEDKSNSGFKIAPLCGPCTSSYCSDEGTRCTFNGSCGGGGCCGYTCTSDPSCSGPDPCPGNACGCF